MPKKEISKHNYLYGNNFQRVKEEQTMVSQAAILKYCQVLRCGQLSHYVRHSTFNCLAILTNRLSVLN